MNRDIFPTDISIMINQTIPVNIITDKSPTTNSNHSNKFNVFTPKKKNSVVIPRKNITKYHSKKHSVNPVRFIGTQMLSPRQGKNLINVPIHDGAYRTERTSPVKTHYSTSEGRITKEKASPKKIIKRQSIVSGTQVLKNDGLSQIQSLVDRHRMKPHERTYQLAREHIRSKSRNK